MSGPTPITADWRLTFLYTVSLFQHKIRHYLDVVASADPTGYDTQPRGGFANAGVSTLEARYFTRLAPFYRTADATFDGYLLETRSGTTWVYVASGVATVAPSGSTPFERANQVCFSGRDSNNKALPRYLYEGAFGTATKLSSADALGANARALVNYYWNVDAGDDELDAYAWSFSRDQKYAQRWLAWVVDTNEKLRRLRRIK